MAAVASTGAELAGELSAPVEATAAIFQTLNQALELLDGGGEPDSLLPSFFLHILKLGGYGPQWDTCRQCGHSPWDYLRATLTRRRQGLAVPPLPAVGG